MDKKIKQNLIYTFTLGFAFPPLTWFFFMWYLDLLNMKEIIKSITSGILPLSYIGINIVIYFFLNKLLQFFPEDRESVKKLSKVEMIKSQRTIYRLPRWYIYLYPVYAFLIATATQTSIDNFLTVNFYLQVSIALSLMIILTTPFFLIFLITLEKNSTYIAITSQYPGLSLNEKWAYVLIPNSIATFVLPVAALSAIAIHDLGQSRELIFNLTVKGAFIGVIAVSTLLLNVFLLKSQFLTPLRHLKEYLEGTIRGGADLSVRIPGETRDELATICTDFNTLIDVIDNIAKQIHTTSMDMENTSEKLTLYSKKQKFIIQKEDEALNEINKSINGISDSLSQLGELSKRHRKDMSKMIEDMEVASKTGNMLVEEIEAVNREIIKANTSSASGDKAITNIRTAMSNIHGVFEEISELLTFLNDLAEKINLLSLNASIEASRAGELGSGFTVVAAQIGRLAEETKKSISSISSLLGKSEANLNSGTDLILTGANAVQNLITSIDHIETTFSKLRKSFVNEVNIIDVLKKELDNVNIEAAGIDASLGSQQSKVNAIIDMVYNINHYSKSGLETSNELNTNAHNNRTIAELLRENISLFQTSAKRGSVQIFDTRGSQKKDVKIPNKSKADERKGQPKDNGKQKTG